MTSALNTYFSARLVLACNVVWGVYGCVRWYQYSVLPLVAYLQSVGPRIVPCGTPVYIAPMQTPVERTLSIKYLWTLHVSIHGCLSSHCRSLCCIHPVSLVFWVRLSGCVGKTGAVAPPAEMRRNDTSGKNNALHVFSQRIGTWVGFLGV